MLKFEIIEILLFHNRHTYILMAKLSSLEVSIFLKISIKTRDEHYIVFFDVQLLI